MARLLDRLSSINAATPRGTYTWAQRVCEQIETLFGSVFTAIASMSEVAPVTITADYQGTVDPSNQLPLSIPIKRYSGDTDVTTSSVWSLTVDEGAITATVGAATGLLEITAVGSSGSITVSATYQGVAKTRLVIVTLGLAAPPATGSTGGGGTSGTTATDTSFTGINSTTHAAISDELTVTVGSSGTVTLSAPLTVRTGASSPAATYTVYGLWRWWDGAAWADVGTEVLSSNVVVSILDPETGTYKATPGTLTVNTSKTGLVAAASEKFQLYARNNSGTRTMSFSGTASAVS